MNRMLAATIVSMMLGVGLTACGGGGGGSTAGGSSSLSASGFKVPTEISAVPTDQSAGATALGFQSMLTALAATDPGTDYSKAVTTRYVEEDTLEQFKIIEQVMNALAQTRYFDAENINNGPYKAMIAWQDERNGIATKTLEPWVIDSSMILENGQEVNRVQAWIEEEDMGFNRLIKAEIKIYASANQNSDGSYRDYGVWKMNVKFDDSASNFFAAEASLGPAGESILKIHENFSEGQFTENIKAILNKSDSQGYGRVSFPDWDSCVSPDCTPVSVMAKYAYNANHLAIQKGSDAVVYKDRKSNTEMTHRYGLYDSVTGEDILRTKSFGFPVVYTQNEMNRFAYYGAWQGRHQLWADGGTVPQGTVVTRQDLGPNQTPETYTVSAPFVGTLTKRTLVPADINDIFNIPVETWVNIDHNLRYDGADWIDCINPDFNTNPPTCGAGSGPFTDFASLVMNPNDMRKYVNINGWDNTNNVGKEYVYDPSGASGAGFYEATMDQNTGQLTSTGVFYSPNTGDELWVNIGGSIYIEYTGTGQTGWVEKTVLSFDERRWTPVFDPDGDMPYTLPLDREYYINNKGANYVVKRTQAGYDVRIELQTVANPINASTFLAAGTVFKPQWDDTGNSTYEFVTSPSDPAKFLKLVYKTVGANDTSLNVSAEDIVTDGQWGLVAYVNDTSTDTQFNWEYPREGEDWGKLIYLINTDASYKLLDDPVMLNPVTLNNNAGDSKTLSFQYDGWMHGLPDLYDELRKNDFEMTPAVSDKIINIPAGMLVTDSLDADRMYLIKPLEVSQFLDSLTTPPAGIDISAADAVDLADVPSFVEHNMGAMPVVSGIKYSEGKKLE